jgi:hypothetical protein
MATNVSYSGLPLRSLPQPPVTVNVGESASNIPPTNLEVNTVNTATIVFVILALVVAAVALALGITAYIKWQDFYNQRQLIINNIRVATFGDTVDVQVASDPTFVKLIVDIGETINPQNLLLNVSLRKQAGNTTISDYPYTCQNNTLQLTIPRKLAVDSQIIGINLVDSQNALYYFNSTVWTLWVAYRVPLGASV